MGNTPNNNFPFPEPTDLVKDGAQAIEDLADAIDTTLGVYAPSTSGLELINTTSFSAVASQSVNDVFSATYDNYRVLLRLTAAGADLTPSLRFRVSGADNSTANYSKTGWFVGSDNSSGVNNNVNQTSYSLGTFDSIAPTYHLHDMLISLPFATDYTVLTNYFTTRNANAVNFTNMDSMLFGATTSFTGLSITTSNSNITGSISVFGINK